MALGVGLFAGDTQFGQARREAVHKSPETPPSQFILSGEIASVEAEPKILTTVEISDERAAIWKARAAAQGLSLEEWLIELAEATPVQGGGDAQGLPALFEEHRRKLQPGDLEWMPEDGASQHDHYIYGLAKRPD